MTTQSDRGLKLEPCPFCGSKAEAMDYLDAYGLTRWHVVCQECGAASKSSREYHITTSEWNTRPVPVTAEVSTTDEMARIVLAKYLGTNYNQTDMAVADMRAALSAALKAQKGVGET